MVEDDLGLRVGAGEVGKIGELGMVKPGLEGEVERRQPRKAGAPGRVEHLPLDRIGARLGERVARIPGDRMPDAAKAPVPGRDLGLQNPRNPVANPQIGMPDDSRAEPGRPVLAARAHRRRPVDELGFAHGLHLDRAIGAVHRAALDENGLGDFVAAADVGEQLIKQKPVPRVVPQVMVGIDDLQPWLDDFLLP
jgi:hypothetical protein